MNEKVAGLLGMCRRAGRLSTGFDAVVELCKREQATVLLAADAAARTVKELHFQLPQLVAYRLPLTKEGIAAAIGSSKPVAVLATADKGFSKAIVKLISEEESHYDD